MGSNASQVLELVIVGKDKGGSRAVADLGNAAEKSGKQTSDLGKTASTAMVGIGLAAGALALKSSQTFNDVGTDVMKLQRYTGESAEAMSQLRFAAKMSGVDVELLGKSMGKAAKTLEGSKDPIAQFGIAAKDTSGHLRPMNQILMEASDKLKGMSSAGDRAAYAQQLFGKAGADMLPLLMKGSDGIKALMDQTSQYNEQLSGDDLDAIKANKEAHRQLDAQVEGFQLRLGRSVMPALTGFTSALASVPGPLLDIAGPLVGVGGGLMAVVGVGMKVKDTALSMASGFSKAAEGTGSMVRGLGTVDGAVRGLSFAAATAGVIAFTHQLQQNSEVAKQWAAGQTGSGTLPERIAETKKNLDDAKKSLEGYASVDLGDTLHLFGSNEGRAQADKVRELEDALKGLEGQEKSATDAAELQKRGVDELGNATGDLSSEVANNATELAKVQTAYEKTTTSLKSYFSEAAGHVDTERALAQAHDDLSRSIATNGVHFDNMTQQGRDNRKAFEDAGTAAIEWGVSQIKAGGNADAAAFAVNLQVESLRRQMVQAGFSQTAVDNYVNSLKLTPADVSTQFHLLGLAQARIDAENLRTSLGWLGKTSVGAWAIPSIPSHAKGAYYPARVGGSSMAIGAEAGQGEFVLPEDKLNAALRAAVAAGGGRGGPTINVTVNVSGVIHNGNEMGRVVVDALLQMKRINPDIVRAIAS